ncbi:hypothetical protein [Paraoerskovia marina]|uniref:hypothetical protein n=1 Tax=Paraoerskovia marina TaxID=545619 RepID=UPI000492C58C|nr:hypothetical protein [Paraoerskovia marina]
MTHEDGPHGPAPLDAVDPAPLHHAVDELAATLHSYIETAAGVRGEFGASESDDDPRVLALETRVGALNATLYDRIHQTLGMHPDLTAAVWEPDGEEGDPDENELSADVFYLGYVVGTAHENAGGSLDGVMEVVDAAGSDLANRLTDAGYRVGEWAVSRGEAPDFFDEEDPS